MACPWPRRSRLTHARGHPKTAACRPHPLISLPPCHYGCVHCSQAESPSTGQHWHCLAGSRRFAKFTTGTQTAGAARKSNGCPQRIMPCVVPLQTQLESHMCSASASGHCPHRAPLAPLPTEFAAAAFAEDSVQDWAVRPVRAPARDQHVPVQRWSCAFKLTKEVAVWHGGTVVWRAKPKAQTNRALQAQAQAAPNKKKKKNHWQRRALRRGSQIRWAGVRGTIIMMGHQ
jgi:hypothetical protein